MNSILFVYFKKDINQLYFAGSEINCVVLRKLLKNTGVEQNQYFSRQLSNVYEIVDDLISEYMDNICFVVDKGNINFTLQVEKCLNQSDEELSIHYLSVDSELLIPGRDVIHMKHAIESFNQILNCNMNPDMTDMLNCFFSEGFIPISELDFGVSICRYVELLHRYCIMQPDNVLNELLFINRHVSESSIIYLYAENIGDYRDQDRINSELKKLPFIKKIKLIIPDNQRKGNRLSAVEIADIESVSQHSALKNGLFDFISGYYMTGDANEYTRHILLNTNDLNEMTLEKLSDKNYANSALYIFDNERTVTYQEAEELAFKTSFLFTNYLYTDSVKKEKIKININQTGNVLQYKKIPYSQYTHNDNECFVEITSQQEYDTYLNDIRYYEATGKVSHVRCWEPMIANNCRWSDQAYCSLCKLPRMRVKDNAVFPCIDTESSLGSIDEMYFELRKKTYMKADKTEKDRKCSECSAAAACSKCSMLPEFISEKDFCSAMQSEYNPVEFSKKMICIKYLFRAAVVDVIKSVKIEDACFMTKHNSIVFENYEKGIEKYLNDYTLFFSIPSMSKYVIFCFPTKKILAVNQDMYQMCELFFHELSARAMEAYLKEHKKLSGKESNQAVKETYNTLKKFGFIRNGVFLKDV